VSNFPNVPALPSTSLLGFDGDPLPGDPRVLQGIVDDFASLRDVAWSVHQGLDAVVASASSGGLEGETAEALREVVSGRLKTFVYNIARAFSLAGEAVAEYRTALLRAQQMASGAVQQAAGLAVKDAKPAELKSRLQGQVDQVSAAAASMEAALRDAAQMMSQPIKVPSLWERTRGKVELALSIVGGVLALLSSVVDAPVGFALGMAAFAAGAAAFSMTAADVAAHRVKWTQLFMAGVGLVGPWAQGMFSMAALGAGARAVVEGTKAAWDVVRSPAQLSGFVAKAVPAAARGVAGLMVGAERGLGWLRGVPWRVVALPSVLKGTPGFFRGVWRSASGAVAEDFAGMVKLYPRSAAVAEELGFVGKAGMYAGINSLRMARAWFTSLRFTSLRFTDIAALGFRGTWTAVWDAVYDAAKANWSRGMAEFRAGWAGYPRLGATGKGLAAVELHELGFARAHVGVVELREPLLAPVTTWTVRDLGNEGFTRSASGLFVPKMEPVHGLETSGMPTRSRLWVPEEAEHGAPLGTPGTVPPVDRLGGEPVVRDGVVGEPVSASRPLVLSLPGGDGERAPLAFFEAMHETRVPEAPQATVRRWEASESGTGGALTSHTAQPELPHTAADDLHALEPDPVTLGSRMQARFQRGTGTEPVTVSIPPELTGVVREEWVDPADLRQTAPRLDGARAQAVYSEGADREPRLALDLLNLSNARAVDPDWAQASAARVESVAPVVGRSLFEPAYDLPSPEVSRLSPEFSPEFSSERYDEGPGGIEEPESTAFPAFPALERLEEGSLPHVLEEQVSRFERVDGKSPQPVSDEFAGTTLDMVRAEELLADIESRMGESDGAFDVVPAGVAELRAEADEKLLMESQAADPQPSRAMDLLNVREADPGEAQPAAPRAASLPLTVRRRIFGPTEDLFEPFSVRYDGERALLEQMEYRSHRAQLERLAGGGPDDPVSVDPLGKGLVNYYDNPHYNNPHYADPYYAQGGYAQGEYGQNPLSDWGLFFAPIPEYGSYDPLAQYYPDFQDEAEIRRREGIPHLEDEADLPQQAPPSLSSAGTLPPSTPSPEEPPERTESAPSGRRYYGWGYRGDWQNYYPQEPPQPQEPSPPQHYQHPSPERSPARPPERAQSAPAGGPSHGWGDQGGWPGYRQEPPPQHRESLHSQWFQYPSPPRRQPSPSSSDSDWSWQRDSPLRNTFPEESKSTWKQIKKCGGKLRKCLKRLHF
jgi:hypothetical protein